MTQTRLGKLAELEVVAMPSAIVCSLVLWIVLSAVAYTVLRFDLMTAVIGGFIGMILHWTGELLHHIGHARAAAREGYPMTGVRLFWLLGASLYPSDEPTLPGAVHIRRALGGPIMSVVVGLVTVVVVVLLSPMQESLVWWLAVFFAVEQFAIFSIGALIPLGFNDGSTILRWWGKP